MNDIEAGRYICIQVPGLMGLVIRASTRSWADHAVLSMGGDDIIEAIPSAGVHLAKLSSYAGCKAAINYGEDMTDVQRERACGAAGSYVGERYNDLDIGDLGLEDLGIHWRVLLHLSGADHRMICSQMVCDAGAAAGLNWSCNRGASCQVRPSDLAKRPGMVPLQITG